MIIVAIGTRPEFIKMEPVVAALRAAGREVRVIATGQHYQPEMIGVAGLRPDDFLHHRPGPVHYDPGSMVARVCEAMTGFLEAWSMGPERPIRAVVVHGDTSSTVGSALAAFYRGIPVVHVEAGLRSGDRAEPFPEEGNRQIVAAVASLHLAPSRAAVDHLVREGVRGTVLEVGNPGYDALLREVVDLDAEEKHARGANSLGPWQPMTVRLLAQEGAHRMYRPVRSTFILATLHRAEGFPDRILEAFRALVEFVELRSDRHVYFPAHPRVARLLLEELAHLRRSFPKGASGMHLLEPVDYRTMVRLLLDPGCCAVVTDSGGLTEEAVALGIPTIVVRRRTERFDLLERPPGGFVRARLASSGDAVTDALLEVQTGWTRRERAPGTILANEYGDGHASEAIADAICRLVS